MKHTHVPIFVVGMVMASQAPVHAEEGTLAEVVVTAQKREQKLQDVPISVSAVGGDQLESTGQTNFREILQSVAGLSFAGNEAGQSNYTIRGVSTAASSPTTGIYLDDVSLLTVGTNFSGAVDPPVFDLERIEVLKGPQGTLYGGSAMGGAIKYVTRQPQLDKTEYNAAAGLASTAGGGISYNVESVVNAPLADGKAAVRAGVAYRDDAGYIDYVPGAQGLFLNRSATNPPDPFEPLPFDSGGTISKKHANEYTNLAARLAFKFDIGGVIILPQATIQRSHEAEPPYFWTHLPKFQASYRYEQPTDDHLSLYSLSITKDFGAMTLTSLTSYSDRSLDWHRDYSYFVGALLPALLPDNTFNTSDTATTTFSQEIRLSSTSPSAALKWVTGLLYASQDDALTQTVVTQNAGAFFDSGTDVVYYGLQATKTKQYAAFADVTYSLTPQWDVSVGLREFQIEQTYNGTFDGVFNGGPSANHDKRSKDTGLNPKLTVSYHPADGHLVYATGGKGFRPGGPNRFNSSSSLCQPDFDRLGITKIPEGFGSDSLWTYEAGSKNTFGGDRLLLNGAVYYTNWKKIQQQVNLPSCGFQFIGNVGSADIKGVEVEFKSIVTNGVTIGVNANYTKSEITSSLPGVSAQVGQPLLNSPEWMGNAFAELSLPDVAGWSSKLRAEVEYRSSQIGQFDSTAVVNLPNGQTAVIPDVTQTQSGYNVVNVSLEARSGRWQARLYVNNVTNSDRLLDTTLARILDTPMATTLRPRTVGILVRTRF